MYPPEVRLPLELALQPAKPKAVNAATSRRAIDILLSDHDGFHCPTRFERQELLVGFAMGRFALPGAAYDIVRVQSHVDLGDRDSIANNLGAITLFEIKSTNRASIKDDLKGYFFNITSAELLIAQTLGERFKFGFVNVLTRSLQELSLAEVMARSRAFYPAWHIKF
jgi:hypothetical protein